MSTTYGIFKRDKEYIEVHEHSSRLDIIIPSSVSSDSYYDGVVPNLTAAQVTAIACELLKVASYHGDLSEMLASQDQYIRDELVKALT